MRSEMTKALSAKHDGLLKNNKIISSNVWQFVIELTSRVESQNLSC